MTVLAPPAPSATTELSLTRLYLIRAGYLLMGVGLVLVKWPLLPDAHTLPVYEGVTLCLLTAMPEAVGGHLDTATTDIAVNCSLVVVIIAVIPWRYAWQNYARAAGDRWR